MVPLYVEVQLLLECMAHLWLLFSCLLLATSPVTEQLVLVRGDWSIEHTMWDLAEKELKREEK